MEQNYQSTHRREISWLCHKITEKGLKGSKTRKEWYQSKKIFWRKKA